MEGIRSDGHERAANVSLATSCKSNAGRINNERMLCLSHAEYSSLPSGDLHLKLTERDKELYRVEVLEFTKLREFSLHFMTNPDTL